MINQIQLTNQDKLKMAKIYPNRWISLVLEFVCFKSVCIISHWEQKETRKNKVWSFLDLSC